MAPKGTSSPPEYKGPSDEEIDAFVLRLRFFIQDNEKTSLRRLHEIIEKDSTISSVLKNNFANTRRSLKRIFDSYPPIKATSKLDPNSPTWGEIFETFIYGELAHSNSQKAKKMLAWKTQERIYLLHTYFFIRILVVVACGVLFLSDLIEAELAGSFNTP